MCKECGCHGGKVEHKVISIEGMTCGHCKSAVERAVRALPGVMAAEVDLKANNLTVDYSVSKSTLDDIIQAVNDAGYKPG
ncbi:MAG: copZ 1 [Firmicutes bacterium]|nr:copZ 1 [Bacillota bacterium]